MRFIAGDHQCVVSPGSGGASSSSAKFFKSSPNDAALSTADLLGYLLGSRLELLL
jgi:hypothetical protein